MDNPYINDLMPGEQYGMPTSTPQTLQRRSRLAQQLLEQGQQPLEGQMVSGRYVAPSWTQGLAKLLSSYQGSKIMGDINKQEQGMAQSKQKAIADILAQSQPKTVEGQPVTTETMPAYTPDQMDRFGSPMPNVQRQPEVTTNTPTRTETPEEIQARLRPLIYKAVGQYGNDPALQLALGDLNYQRERGARKEDITDQRGYEEKLYNRDRKDKLTDTEAAREFERTMEKSRQGFQLTQQEKQFANQYKLQQLNQGFQASQQAKSQQFQAGQNALSRKQQIELAGAKNIVPQTQKANDAKDVLGILQQAAPLINTSTGSGLGAMYDATQGFFGGSNEGAVASSQLKALEGLLVSKMPKMSGPQSDKDVLLYKQMAGQIGDPTLPPAQKRAAMQTIAEINARYAGVDVPQLNFDTSKALQGLNINQNLIEKELARRNGGR